MFEPFSRVYFESEVDVPLTSGSTIPATFTTGGDAAAGVGGGFLSKVGGFSLNTVS